MANTYTRIYIHIVFTVEGRQSLIWKEYREELHKYITGIIQNKGQKVIKQYYAGHLGNDLANELFQKNTGQSQSTNHRGVMSV